MFHFSSMWIGIRKIRLMNPRVLDASEEMVSVWIFPERLEVNLMPRYLYMETGSITLVSIVY